MPRSYSQARIGDSAALAIGKAMAYAEPGAPAGRKGAKDASGDDYERIGGRAVELLSRDTLRDDGHDDKLLPRPDNDPDGPAVQARLAELKAAGKADGVRVQQGGVVATRKGVVVEWLVPADRRQDGTLPGSAARAAERQRKAADREGLDYAERVDRRLRAIARSWIGKAGDHDEVQAAMRKAFIEDRKRRGWRVPDFTRERDDRENDDENEWDD